MRPLLLSIYTTTSKQSVGGQILRDLDGIGCGTFAQVI
jgi:hypothetical protein